MIQNLIIVLVVCGGFLALGLVVRVTEARKQVARERAETEWLRTCPASDLPPLIVRTYPGQNYQAAARLFGTEAGLLGQRGYVPTALAWAPGKSGGGGFVLFGLVAGLMSRTGGGLVVAYHRPGASPF